MGDSTSEGKQAGSAPDGAADDGASADCAGCEGAGSIGELIAMAQSPDPQTRGMLASALAHVEDQRAFGILVDLLSDSDQKVRSTAVMALGEKGGPHAVEALLPILEEGSAEMTCTVLAALARIGDERSFAPIVSRLFDADDDVRKNAAASIGTLHDPRAYEPLMMCLDDSVEWVRANAALSLGMIGCMDAVAKLEKIADSDDTPLVRANASSAVGALAIGCSNAGGMTSADAADVSDGADADVDPDDAAAVSEQALEFVLGVMEDTGEDPKVRIASMLVFGENLSSVCEVSARAAAIAFSDICEMAGSEPDDDVRASAIWCLGQMCRAESAEKLGISNEAIENVRGLLEQVLCDYRSGSDVWCARYAVEALANLGGKQSAEAISQFATRLDAADAELVQLCDTARACVLVRLV